MDLILQVDLDLLLLRRDHFVFRGALEVRQLIHGGLDDI
jgi:hypothetical protein